MVVPGIENLANPRKKNKRENLGDRGHRLRPSNVPSGTDANLVNLAFDVPDDVLTNIFSFLPIKEAVQASTVATRFKQSWFFNRKLCFDKDFAKRHAQKDFLNIVNRVFELHVGQNIQTLRLFFDPTGVEDAVENWIQISIDKEVEELDLNFSLAKDPYRITTDFADFESIKILKLCRCELDLLPTFRGLNSLKTLVLRRIEINSKFLETVFSNCLSLETLELVKCRKIGHLRILAQNLRRFKALKVGDCLGLYQVDIDAPTIRSIHYSGIFILFKFVEISQLNDVILNFKPLKGIEKFFRRDSFLCDLSHIAVLSARNTLLEDLSPEYFHRILRFHFGKLKELQLFMENAVCCNLYHIAYFLKKCPRLEKLFIEFKGFSFEPKENWKYQSELVERDIQPLKCLQFIKMVGFTFEDHEIEILQYLLERAVVLEDLVLVCPKTTKEGVVNVQNILFCRKICERVPVSPLAKVRFCDRDTDKSPSPKHSKTWF